jgi:hypothetical protein
MHRLQYVPQPPAQLCECYRRAHFPVPTPVGSAGMAEIPLVQRAPHSQKIGSDRDRAFWLYKSAGNKSRLSSHQQKTDRQTEGLWRSKLDSKCRR